MSYLSSNLRHLRRQNTLTQSDLAQKLGIKRSLLGAYEEQRAEPKIATIQKMAYLFKLPLETFINHDMTKRQATAHIDTSGQTLRVLPIVTTPDNTERITLVPATAEAGYADAYADPEFIESLPSFSLPLPELYQDATYRLFQIHGDSMLPITPRSYIITSYVQNWNDIKDGQCYIIVTRNRGVVYKRVWNHLRDRESLLLKSDNTIYSPYELEATELLEAWKAVGSISFALPEMHTSTPADIRGLSDVVARLCDEVEGLKKTMDDR
ncbi:MAG TPA: LexA family transcriptional regulator [Saprospiraceae bacterium]|nr:LexA family transcriptional regulator [Saprospiraceae bacterium]